MPELLVALEASVHQHRRYGEWESGVENVVVWMCCTCGAQIVRAHNPREMAT